MRETCEGQLTYSECFKVLSTFSNDKTPGNDGLTVEFYKFFWSEIGTFLVDSLNYAYFHGELSNSQKEAVITLIQKKDKDRRWIKNWRPISLVNVDVKIGSKAVAKRPETILPHIIYYDQNAFVKGRILFEAARLISNVKKNISSCVINNGFSTPSFNLKWSVCQGDSLSPSLSITVLEFLALSIRNNDQINGIVVDGSEIKLVIFADDMTSFVRDKLLHSTFLILSICLVHTPD